MKRTPIPKWDKSQKQWRLRFTFEGVRFDYRSTTIERTDVKSATAWAAERIQYVFSGQWKTEVTEGKDPDALLSDVAALYLAEARGGLITRETADLRKIHFGTHLVPFFPRLRDITKASLASYQAERLKSVQYSTVKKELSTLYQALKYAERHGWIAELPKLPERPAKSLGTKHRYGASGFTEGFTDELARAVIAHLPLETRFHRATGRHWPFRAFFAFMAETGLRPGTIRKLRLGKHWVLGARELHITADIDKNRWARPVPLSEAAVELLTEVAKTASSDGQLFEVTQWRLTIKDAARRAGLPPEMAARVHPYDFRHARGTELANTGKILGTAYLLGHKQMTTTNRYSHANKMQASELVGLLEPSTTQAPEVGRIGAESGADVKKGLKLWCEPLPETLSFTLCEGEDSNLHGSYPASTSRMGPEGKYPENPDGNGAPERSEAHQSKEKVGRRPNHVPITTRGAYPPSYLAIVAHKLGLLPVPCGVLV